MLSAEIERLKNVNISKENKITQLNDSIADKEQALLEVPKLELRLNEFKNECEFL